MSIAIYPIGARLEIITLPFGNNFADELSSPSCVILFSPYLIYLPQPLISAGVIQDISPLFQNSACVVFGVPPPTISPISFSFTHLQVSGISKGIPSSSISGNSFSLLIFFCAISSSFSSIPSIVTYWLSNFQDFIFFMIFSQSFLHLLSKYSIFYFYCKIEYNCCQSTHSSLICYIQYLVIISKIPPCHAGSRRYLSYHMFTFRTVSFLLLTKAFILISLK